MNSYFRRQLADYADYHRDILNRWLHIIGNPIITFAVFLPLSLVSVPIFGVHVTAAALLVIPALIVWMAFDFGLGLAIVVSAIPLLIAADIIAKNVSLVWLWIITSCWSSSAGRCKSSGIRCLKAASRRCSTIQSTC